MLARARAGEIVFFLMLGLVVWLWARRLTNDFGAAVATLLLVANPNILAHAGLATTDIACAATTTLALFAGVWWIERPSWARSVLFAIAIGAAVSSRLSSLAFVGGSLVVSYLVRWWARGDWTFDRTASTQRNVAKVAVIAAGVLIVIWGSYRFAVGPLEPGGIPVPAPAFVAGIERFLLHGSSGHPTFLLGTPSNTGWWYYFPIALLVKTPVPLLILGVVGAAAVMHSLRRRRRWQDAVPLLSAATMILISLAVKVDIGVRLILPVFPLLAIVGAQGVSDMLRRNASLATRGFAGAALAIAAVIPVLSHPDHLAYFNLLAGNAPARILVDSNLDWGQDLYRLRDTIAARGINDTVRVAYFGTADLSAAGLTRARILGLNERPSGWIAASETFLAGEWVGRAYSWLLDYPEITRIGPSMRLWYIPPANVTTGSSRQ
jgi:hypothetical protein